MMANPDNFIGWSISFAAVVAAIVRPASSFVGDPIIMQGLHVVCRQGRSLPVSSASWWLSLDRLCCRRAMLRLCVTTVTSLALSGRYSPGLL